MIQEKDSVTKVLASFVVFLAIGGVGIMLYAGIEYYRKANETNDKVYLVDFVGLATTRIEVYGNEKMFNLLKQSGGIAHSSSLEATPPWLPDNQCSITPHDASWFPKFRMMCWELGKTQPKKFESYSSSSIVKEATRFHKSRAEATTVLKQ